MTTASAPTVRLTSQKVIVERGTTTTTWYVEMSSRWTPAHELPGALIERKDPPAGTVWVSETTVPLPPGTRVKRVDASPAPERRRDPLSYLRGGPRLAARATREAFYVVTRSGTLARDSASGR